MTTKAQNTVRTTDLAKVLADAEGRLRGLIKAGKITEKSGRVGLVEAVTVFLDDLRTELRANTASAASERARAARAEAASLRLAERRREVIPRDQAEAGMEFLTGAVNSALIALPARVTRDPRYRRMVEQVVFNVRDQIAKDVGASQ